MLRYLENARSRMSRSESLLHDIVRSFLMLQVFLGHVAYVALPEMGVLLSNPIENCVLILFKAITRFGPQSAYLFVFLSGYLIFGGLLLTATSDNFPTMRAFVSKRVRRLWPVMFVAVVVTFFLDSVAVYFLEGYSYYSSGYSYDMVEAAGLKEFAGNVLFLQPTFVSSFGSNGPLWTLGYLVQFYFAGYLVVAALRKATWMAAVMVVLISMLMAVFKFEWFLLFLVWMFGGILRVKSIKSFGGNAAIWMSFAIFVFSNLLPVWASECLAIVVGALFTFWSRASDCELGRRLEIAGRIGGRYGYAIYALHFPVVLFVHYSVFDGEKLSAGGGGIYMLISIFVVGVMAAAVVSLEERINSKRCLA